MITKERYLENPCRIVSIPYWKAIRITIPDNMKILHEDEFDQEILENYIDDPYFRIKHDLHNLAPAVIPAGFSLGTATPAEYAAHINCCYNDIGVTEAELQGYTEKPVYCPELWIAVRSNGTGEIAATGIAELDNEIGEGVLEWIQVSKEFRRHGLGEFLVLELLKRIRDMALFVTVSGRCRNATKPEALYRKCGFTGNDVWHVLHKK